MKLSLPWNAQILRLTLFPKGELETVGLWTRLVGESPVADEYRPREGIRRQSGPFGGGTLHIGASASRVDIVMSPSAEDSGLPGYYIGGVNDVFESFISITQPWLESTQNDLVRMAFGVTAHLPMADRKQSYERLQSCLPTVKLDAETMKEFVYQVNRPKQSRTTPELQYNRVMKWSAGIFRSVVVDTAALSTATASEEYVASAELDYNTPAEHTEPFEKRLLLPIYGELRELTLQTLEHGELA